MLKQSSRWAFRIVVGIGLILLVSTLYLVHKEHETLSRLLHPGENFQATEIYSRWLELKEDDPPTWERVVAWLEMLGYRSVPEAPTQPGDYRTAGSDLSVFVRAFRYPDKDYPAQLLELEFSDHQLRKIQAVAGHATLAEWRLEPKRLAEWTAASKTVRAPVRISELPPYVPGAILAIEDKRFYQHGAFDAMGILRAFWVDLRYRELRQGASTISQQLARSIFLDVHRSWRRKVQEAALAIYLEIRFPKPQLLEMYLNQVYWGHESSENLVGIESVSRALFGKPARALTVAESATLAGMLQSPNRYSPRNTSKGGAERRKIVLALMRDQKFITEDQYRTALAEKILLVAPKKSDESAYFLAALRDQLSERYSLPILLSEGWKVFTTLDPLLQRDAVKAVASPALRAPSLSGRGRGAATGEAFPQAALIAIDPANGAIRAWVGGTNYQTNPFDHAFDAKRQPGSAFKPFVALAALESRKATTATLLEDKPLKLKGERGDWAPQNYDHKYRGTASLWDSVVYSYNVPMVRLAMQTGLATILDVARRAGIASPLREDLSLALGTSEVSLVELTGAYATLASGGMHNVPYSIETILGPQAQVLEAHQSVPEFAFSPQLTFIVTQILEAVLDVGTGKASRPMGLVGPAAGKTGTSENYQDAWFVGYTPKVVCGVWVGFDLPKSLGHSAAGIALPLWTFFMKRIAVYDTPLPFEEPKDLTWKTIDPASGLLARSGCTLRRKAAFLPGTEPTQDCPLHKGGIVGFFKRLTNK